MYTIMFLDAWGCINLLLLSLPTKVSYESLSSVILTEKNQSVENAGVVFVKGANERNEFFEKVNK